MNGIGQLSSPVCTRIVLTFVHFLWQGVALAVLGRLLVWAAARHSARLRYGIYVVSLLSMVLSVFVTYGLLDVSVVSEPPALSLEPARILNDSVAIDHAPIPTWTGAHGSRPIPATTDPSPIKQEKPQQATSAKDPPPPFDWHQCVPYTMGLYCLGALILLLRLVLGLTGGQRLRKLASPVDNPSILQILRQQSQRIGLATVPAIALCKQVMVPTVVGVLRPVILLPLAFGNDLSPQQIQMLIVHELAHIRRYDPLVNVLQRVIEALLFFHPAVWFVSHRIRVERENCCDDMVLGTGAKATDYASSLLEVAQQTLLAASSKRPITTELNATGRTSRIGNRIRRLTGSPVRRQVRLKGTGIVAFLVVIAIALSTTVAITSRQNHPQEDLSVPSTPEGAQKDSVRAGGGLVIQPMVFVHTSRGGNRVVTKIRLDNRFGHRVRMTAKSSDLVQGGDGHWVPVEPNTTQVESAKNRSCRKWISLGRGEPKLIEIKPGETYALEVDSQVPPDARGTYYAGVVLTLLSAPEDQAEYKSKRIVPVLLEIGESGISPGNGVPPAAHFAVYPMKYSLKSKPGRSIETKLYLQNLRPHSDDSIRLEVINLRDPNYTGWFADESNAPNPENRALLDKKPCHNWISLSERKENLAETELVHLRPVDLEINVPPQTQGSFNAGILITCHSDGNKSAIAVKYEFVVPICLEIGETTGTEPAIDFSELKAIVKQKWSFNVAQDVSSSDPTHSYSGASWIEFHTNFPASLQTSAQATGPAGGNWRSAVTPKTIFKKTKATVSLKGNDVRLEKLFGPDETVKVAEITLTVIPHCSDEPAEEVERPTSTKSREDEPDRESQDATTRPEPEPGTIQGRVLRSDGSPCVEQDYVVEINGTGQKVLCEIDAQGRFSGTGLFVGHYVVSVRDFFSRHRLLCEPIEVELDPQMPSQELTFALGHEVSVQVLTLNEDDLKPVPQTFVMVESIHGTFRLAHATTDPNGCCELSLVPGRYRIRVDQGSDRNPDSFLVKSSDKSLGITLFLSPQLRSPQRVVKGVLVNSAGRRIKGFVDLSQSIRNLGQETVPSDTFAIPIMRHAPDQGRGYACDVSGRLGLRFTHQIDDSSDSMTLVLQPRAKITGQVVDTYGQGVSDTDLCLVTPCADGHSVVEDPATYTSSTDDNGCFQFECMVGDPQVRVRASWEDLHAQSDLLDLEPGKTMDVGKIVLRKLQADNLGTVRGRITDEQGEPLTNCPVSIEYRGQTRTDAQGYFALTGLPLDLSFTVTAEIPGYGSRSRTATAGDLDCSFQACPPGWGILGKEAPPLCIDNRFRRSPMILRELRGKVVLLQFRPEDADRDLPFIRELYREYGFKGLVVIALLDPAHIPKFNPFQSNIPFPWFIDDDPEVIADRIPEERRAGGATHSLYHAHKPSTFFLIDKQGIVRVSPSEDDLEIWIQRLLAEEGNSVQAPLADQPPRPSPPARDQPLRGRKRAFLDPNTILEEWESNYTNLTRYRFKGTEKVIDPPVRHLMKSSVVFSYEDTIRDGKYFHISYLFVSGDVPDTFDPNLLKMRSYNGHMFKTYDPMLITGNRLVRKGSIYPEIQSTKVRAGSLLDMCSINSKTDVVSDDFPDGIPCLSGEIRWGIEKKIISVRPVLEEISGTLCHVIDINDTDVYFSRIRSYWFAHDNGMLLMRHETRGDGEKDFLFEVQKTGRSETDQGVFWYPERAIRRYAPIGRVITWQIDIDTFEINMEVYPEMFDIDFPKGTDVQDFTEPGALPVQPPRPDLVPNIDTDDNEFTLAAFDLPQGTKVNDSINGLEYRWDVNSENEPVSPRILDSVSLVDDTITGWVVDENYCPVANARVVATPLKCLGVRQALESEARTDNRGRFVFSQIVLGEEYLLEFYAPAFNYKTEIVFPGAFKETTTVLQAQSTRRLSGHVAHAQTNQAVTQAQVTLIGERAYRKTVLTDENGRFSFEDVPRNLGQGVLFAQRQNERSAYRMVRNNIEYVDLELGASSRVKGSVISQTTGRSIAGCAVQAKPRFMSGFALETTTDQDGTYVFNHVAPGEYVIWARHAEWFQPPNRGDFLEPPEIMAQPGTVSSHTVAMMQKATVQGRVVGPDEQPVANAIVCAKSAQGPNYSDIFDVVRSGRDGTFKLRTGKLAGIGHTTTVDISAVGDGVGYGSVTLKGLEAGETRNGINREAVIQLSGVMSVSGYVKDPTGKPIPYVYVYVQKNQWPYCVTDDFGRFHLNSLPLPDPPNRDLKIYFEAPRPDTGNPSMILSLDEREPALMPSSDTQYYLHQTVTAKAQHGSQVELDTVLTPTQQLRFAGQVTDSAGVPIARANLMLFAGNVPIDEWRYEMHPETRRNGFILDNRSHAALCRTVTDKKGRYRFCVVRETAQSLGIKHFSMNIDPTVFSIAAEALDGRTKLLQDLVLSSGAYAKEADIRLTEK